MHKNKKMGKTAVSPSKCPSSKIYLCGDYSFVLHADEGELPNKISKDLLDELTAEDEIYYDVDGNLRVTPNGVLHMNGTTVSVDIAEVLEGERPYTGDRHKLEPGFSGAYGNSSSIAYMPTRCMRSFQSGSRLLFQLSKKLFMLESTDGSLAVHLFTDKALALQVLNYGLTLREAKKNEGHFTTIRHTASTKDRLREYGILTKEVA